MRRPLYVAGPFAGPDQETVRQNVGRALGLGRLAVECGYAPLVPHAIGWLGVHGGNDETLDLRIRPAALTCGVSLALAIARATGHLWIILRDDGSMSDGTSLEYDGFLSQGGPGAKLRVTTHTWEDWATKGARCLLPPDDLRLEELRVERDGLRDETRRLGELVTEYRDRVGY